MVDKNLVIEKLRGVLDPEIGRSIVELNMVRDVTIDDGNVSVKIALTVAHCPLAKTLQTDVENAVRKLPEVRSVKVETTTMSRKELEELKLQIQAGTGRPTQSKNELGVGPGIERLGRRGVRSIIAIISGKGGVGKSFVTSMLASELKRRGYEVGVLDADLTGPSIAKVLGVSGKPFKGPGGGIVPLRTKTGIKVMSINLVLDDPSTPVIWRGPIVNSVIRQLYWDVDWGDLHYLLVDLPPGCVSSDTMVYANPHPVPINQLNPGDHVYSVDASISESGRSPNALTATLVAKRVLEVLPQGEAEVFEIRTRTRKIAATLNHPFLALAKARSSGGRNYRYSLYWKPLGQLRPGDVIAMVKRLPQNEAVPLELPSIAATSSTSPILPSRTTDDLCRIVGYFMGDGFVRLNPTTRTYQVVFAEPINGRYRAKYIELIERVIRGVRISKNAFQFGVSSKKLALLFDKLELHRSALQKRVPKWVFGLPESQKLAFIEGYCDADGFRRLGKSRFRRPGWMVFETPNRGLLEGIRALAISVRLKVTNLDSRIRSLETPSGHSDSTTFWSFECNFSTRTSRYGAGLIRGNGRQAVGRALVNQYVGFERVSKVTPLGRREVYDIRVEGNENFIADGLVVHNTSDAPLTVFQSLPLDGVVVVSSPQDLASMIVSKAVNMAKKMDVPALGLIENFSYLQCPSCGERVSLFGESKGEKFAASLGLPFLGAIPLDPAIAQLSDQGRIEDYSSPIIAKIADELRTRAAGRIEQLTQELPIAWSVEPSK